GGSHTPHRDPRDRVRRVCERLNRQWTETGRRGRLPYMPTECAPREPAISQANVLAPTDVAMTSRRTLQIGNDTGQYHPVTYFAVYTRPTRSVPARKIQTGPFRTSLRTPPTGL